MLGLVFDGKLTLRDDLPPPRRRSGEALVRVLRAGICNTDLEITRGYMGFRGVLGHEFVGQVERADDAALVGRVVVGEINCPCLVCPTCKAGLTHHCPSRTVLGIKGRDGAFAEYLTLPEANLHVVPPSVPLEDAVFTEPLAAACRILQQVRVTDRTDACVFGDGKLGLLVAQVLRLHTPNVTVVGRHAAKLKLLSGTGIRLAQLELFKPRRFSLTVDCTGSAEGLALAARSTRPQGTLVLKTTTQEPAPVVLAPLVVDEITVVGSRCGPFKDALTLLARRKVRVSELVSARLPLRQGLRAFELARRSDSVKVILNLSEPEIRSHRDPVQKRAKK